MATNVESETLEVRRTLNAPRQRVFDAWTKADEMKQWAAPGPLTVSLAESDLRIGGKFRIHMRAPDGVEHRAFGEYREVDPPKKVVYTWYWESRPDMAESIVSVDFHDLGGRTEVVLRHSGLATADERASHEKGWVGFFDKLDGLLSAS